MASTDSGPTYAALLDRLFAARRFGMDLGTERMEALLSALGSPHRSIPHRALIAGTNGKGSTATMLESILRCAGHRTGLFRSPHLHRFAERFAIDGEPAGDAQIATAAAAVSAAGGDSLTFFEQCTAIAAVLFAECEVSAAVFEVGLGGRLDATRALSGQVVAVTGVAFDHQEILGDSLAAIAFEKVSAAEEGALVVLGRGGAGGSMEAMIAASTQLSHRTHRVTAADVAAVPEPLGLAGPFQRTNAATAVAAARALVPAIEARAISDGLAQARLPGRFEVLDGDFVLDGAHNSQGAAALAEALAELPNAPTLGIVGLSEDKDAAAIVAAMGGQLDQLWATRGSSDRAMAPERIARAAGANATVEIIESLEAALARARAWPGRVVVFGSLLLVGEARRWLLGLPGDRVELSDPR